MFDLKIDGRPLLSDQRPGTQKMAMLFAQNSAGRYVKLDLKIFGRKKLFRLKTAERTVMFDRKTVMFALKAAEIPGMFGQRTAMRNVIFAQRTEIHLKASG